MASITDSIAFTLVPTSGSESARFAHSFVVWSELRHSSHCVILRALPAVQML